MSDLAEFLLARIAEDEAVAQAATHGPWKRYNDELWSESAPVVQAWGYDNPVVGMADADADHVARWDPARVLAECDAKRRIVAADWRADDSGEATLIRQDVLRLLALPYADHPDYRQEWKP